MRWLWSTPGRRWVLALAAVLCALELALSALGGARPAVERRLDERVGWRLLPDQLVLDPKSGVAESINSNGYRDHEWEPPSSGASANDDGVLRIAVLGNSISYGPYVEVERTWPRIVERVLAERLLRRRAGERPTTSASAQASAPTAAAPASAASQHAPSPPPAPSPSSALSPSSTSLPQSSRSSSSAVAAPRDPGELGAPDRDTSERAAVERGTVEPDATEAHVMNFAMPGYVLEQMARVCELDALAFHPDVVIVALLPYDIRSLSQRLVSQRSFVRDALARTAIYRRLLSKVIRDPDDGIVELEAQDREQAQSEYRRIRRDPFGAPNRESWDAARAALERTRELCERQRARLVVVCVPLLSPLVEPAQPWTADELGAWFAAHPDVLAVDPRAAFASAMDALIAEQRASGRDPRAYYKFGNPQDLMRAPSTPEQPFAHDSDDLFLRWDALHYSARGHECLAYEVMRALRARGWID